MKKTIWIGSILALLLLLSACSNDSEDPVTEEANSMEDITGTWEGSIQVPIQPLPIIVKFEEEGGTLSIPLQGLNNYPFSAVEFNDPDLVFDLNLQGQRLVFDGKLENSKISGDFTQQGQTFPFELTPGTAEETVEEENFIEIEVAGGTMKAEVEMPEGEGPFPAMLILAGSGPTDRDGNSMMLPGKNDSLKMVAEELAANGIASIRYDKRGVGGNCAPGKETILNDFENALQFILYTSPHRLHQHVGCGFFFLFIRINCLGIVSFPGKQKCNFKK